MREVGQLAPGWTRTSLPAPWRVVTEVIDEIVCDQRRISATAGRFFGTSEQFKINLPSRYDLEVEKARSATCPAAGPQGLASQHPGQCAG